MAVARAVGQIDGERTRHRDQALLRVAVRMRAALATRGHAVHIEDPLDRKRQFVAFQRRQRSPRVVVVADVDPARVCQAHVRLRPSVPDGLC